MTAQKDEDETEGASFVAWGLEGSFFPGLLLLPAPAAGFFLSLPPPVAAVLELSDQPTVLGNSSCI